MAGLGGRRALELLAQGLVEVLAEDRQVQQQQQGLQQQAFQAGMAAAGVVVQQGSTVRPFVRRTSLSAAAGAATTSLSAAAGAATSSDGSRSRDDGPILCSCPRDGHDAWPWPSS